MNSAFSPCPPTTAFLLLNNNSILERSFVSSWYTLRNKILPSKLRECPTCQDHMTVLRQVRTAQIKLPTQEVSELLLPESTRKSLWTIFIPWAGSTKIIKWIVKREVAMGWSLMMIKIKIPHHPKWTTLKRGVYIQKKKSLYNIYVKSWDHRMLPSGETLIRDQQKDQLWCSLKMQKPKLHPTPWTSWHQTLHKYLIILTLFIRSREVKWLSSQLGCPPRFENFPQTRQWESSLVFVNFLYYDSLPGTGLCT